jgi:hypothetical protein
VSSVHQGGTRPQVPQRIIVGVGDTISKVDRDEFDRRATAAGGPQHLEAVFAAIRAGRLTFVVVPQGSRYRSLPDNATNRPLLLVLGDDMDTSRGPGAFDTKTLRRALGSAGHVTVYAAGAEARHYATAVAAAQRHGKAVIVECQPHTESAWLAAAGRFAPGAGVLAITPNSARYQAHGGRA